MKITVKQLGNNFNLQASNEDGHSLLMDSAPDFGGEGKGLRPMQVLLSALGGCTAIDVIAILKKQKQSVDAFEITVDGTREKINDYSLFKNICLNFNLKGNIDADKAERAVKLSLDKYCSVAKTLEPTASIKYTISINKTIHQAVE